MAKKLTPLSKVLLLILALGILFSLWRWVISPRLISGTAGHATGGPVPGRDRPLRVGIVTWPGYAGGIVANNGFKPNKDSIYGRDRNLQVEFTLQEDVDVRNKLFAKGGANGLDIVWSTVDFWANELPGLSKNGVKARAIMQVDWSRGGDAIVVDDGIKRVEDLPGKTIALAQFTPSHWLLEDSLSNSSLDDAAQSEIYKKLVFKTASPDALADFLAKKADAAVVWEPDVTASKQRANTHILLSSQSAPKLIADIMVAREDLIRDHPEVIKDFVQGWLEGTVEANRKPDKVVELLMANEPVYAELGREKTRATLPTVRWADMADNAEMFGLDGSEPLFDAIFQKAGAAWSKRGYISTTVSPADAKNDSFLRELYGVMKPAAPAEPCGAKPKGRPAAGAVTTKLVNIQFASGSAELDDAAKKTLDEQVGLLARTHSGSFIGIEGNTDNVGNPALNRELSKRRADAVVAYLVERYKCYPERFIARGNGPDKPVADNSTPEGRAQNRRTDVLVIPSQ